MSFLQRFIWFFGGMAVLIVIKSCAEWWFAPAKHALVTTALQSIF